MPQKVSYYELLKHPKWQKRRLEVLQEAGFRCEECGAEDATLHVHHAYYEKGLAPWDYLAQSLHCLCENCHKRAQDRADLGVGQEMAQDSRVPARLRSSCTKSAAGRSTQSRLR